MSRKLVKFINAKAFCFALVLIALFSSASFGQSITWQRIYNGPSQISNDYGYASCRADGQNMYILGSISNWVIYLLKINQFGDTLWSRKIGSGFSRGRAIVESDSGSCVLTGDFENRQAFAIKVSKEGNIIWQKFYGSDYVQLNAITKVKGTSYLLCGRENFDNGIVLLIDSLGDLKWKKIYSASVNLNFQSSCELNENNGYLLTGWKTENPNEPAKGILYKIDSEGILTWDTTFTFMNYATAGRKLIKTNNGYFLCGDIHNNKIFFIRTNLNGSIAYTKIYDTLYNSYDIGGFEMINSNKYIMNFSQDSNSFPTFGKIIILDTLANELRSKIYTSQRQVTFGSFTLLNDTGFMFTGTIDNNTSSGRDVYIIKTDTLLNAEPPIGINQISITKPNTFKLHQNYPNPFNPVTNIQFDIPNDANVSIRIYDLLGREVFSVSEYKQAGSYEMMFDGSNLASGLYFYSLEASPSTGSGRGYFETKKMVLIK